MLREYFRTTASILCTVSKLEYVINGFSIKRKRYRPYTNLKYVSILVPSNFNYFKIEYKFFCFIVEIEEIVFIVFERRLLRNLRGHFELRVLNLKLHPMYGRIACGHNPFAVTITAKCISTLVRGKFSR